MDDPKVIRVGLFDLQVCVPEEYTDAQVTQFANSAHPVGTKNGWMMKKNGNETLRGDPERKPCERRKGYVHVMFEC